MIKIASLSLALFASACTLGCHAPSASQTDAGSSTSVTSGRPTDGSAARVVDVPTRSGVTDRVLVLAPEGEPKAAVILFAGGNGGLRLGPPGSNGAIGALSGNFLIRSRQLFVDHGLLTVAIDAPSDRQSQPYMANGFRESAKSVADVHAVIAWLRTQTHAPVWLVGTSHGTQSVAFAATSLSGADAPDGIVLTSTVTRDDKEKSIDSWVPWQLPWFFGC